MKKLLLILLMFPIVCLGQNLIQAEYFFDTDPGYGHGIKLNFPAMENTAMTSNLYIANVEQGFHTLFYRFKDDNIGWGHTFYRNVFIGAEAQTIVQGEMFYDKDPGLGNGQKFNFNETNQLALTANLYLGAVPPGFHTLYYRLKDKVDNWGQTFYRNVFLSLPAQNVSRTEYFFDTDPGYGNGMNLFDGSTDATDINTIVSLEDIEPGYHVLYYRSEDEGSWGETFRHPFFKTLAPKLNAVLYSFDDEESLHFISLDTDVWEIDNNFDIDISSLPNGDHTIHIWVQNNQGDLSEVWSETFYAGVLGIEKPKALSLGIYPNPASDLIRFRTKVVIQSVTLLSLKGDVVKTASGPVKEIDVHDVPNGLYLLSIKNSKGLDIHTVVINH